MEQQVRADTLAEIDVSLGLVEAALGHAAEARKRIQAARAALEPFPASIIARRNADKLLRR